MVQIRDLVLVGLITAQCTNPVTHVEWRELTSGQQTNYLRAVQCMRTKPSKLKKGGARTIWEDLVWVHAASISIAHSTAAFLPWQ